MPLVFPVVLLLILGAVTLASRSTNSYLMATKQSDAQAARQAAESGMSRVLIALNPSAKGATDPYFGFLLASGWDATANRWVVAAPPPNCRLSVRGIFSTQTAGTPTDLLGGVIGTPANNTEMRYRIVGYSPPKTTPSPPWPPSCNALLDPLTNQPTSLTGGAARISVEGQVWRGGRQVASYTLTRTLDVQGSPFPDLPPAWEALSFSPGPPIALRITGTAVGVGQLTSAIYQNFEEDAYLY